jgi:hypothetical protein
VPHPLAPNPWNHFVSKINGLRCLFQDDDAQTVSQSQNKASRKYPHFGGASCADIERVEMCIPQIPWDSVGIPVYWCGFMSDFFDVQVSSLVIVATLVRWSFGNLARQLHVYLL